MNQEESISLELQYLNGENAVFAPLGTDFLCLTFQGTDYTRVSLHKTMPFTYPERFIAVKDQEGKEIGMIEDLSAFGAETRALLERMLSLRYYCPVVQSILDVKDKFGFMYVTMHTDAGPRSFASADLTKSIRKVQGDRYLIVDVEGNRFLIEDLFRLKNHKKILPYIV